MRWSNLGHIGTIENNCQNIVSFLTYQLLGNTWDHIKLEDFEELLRDVVLAHTVLQGQVELVAGVEHLVAKLILTPEVVVI